MGGKFSRWRWTALALAGVAVTVAVVLLVSSGADSGEAQTAGAPAADIVQPGAPGQSSRKLSEDDAAKIETPKHTKADVEFMQGMIHHHAQALEMTDFVPDRAVGRDVTLMARRMKLSQQAEIELMEQWLKDRDEEIPGAGEHEHGHGGELMPGMLTPAEMDRLQAARGRRFNRLFLVSMMGHHRGALTMIRELFDKNGGAESETDAVLRNIDTDQTLEIGRMERVLAKLK